MSDVSPQLALPLILADQAQKHVSHNEAIDLLDVLVQLVVEQIDAITPPPAAVEGVVWALGEVPVGAWAGQALRLASWRGGAWVFIAPAIGWRAWVRGAGVLRVFTGSGWVGLLGANDLQNLGGVGINTASDATNKLAVASAATLLSHVGAGHQLKINKATTGNTASLLFQSGWSGRAEMGLAGNDDFSVKVSGNGSTWASALTVNRNSGRAIFKKVQNGPRPWNVVHRNYVAGATWLTSTGAADIGWRGICWSPELGLFCAVAYSGTGNRVMTSPDGITWTARTSAADNSWLSVCWSPELGLFCAVAIAGTAGNRVMTSPDGITWTLRASAADSGWRSICWSPELGLFCAVASSGVVGSRVMTSPDGITWTLRAAAAAYDWWSICWSPELGLFCAVSATGTGDRVMTSPDGITWTLRTSAADNAWYSVCWSPELGLFCAIAATGTGNRVMTSPDGITWTARTSAADNVWYSVCWSPELGLFCAIAATGAGNRVMTSPDGITWTLRTSAANNDWRGVCWSPELGLFCAVGETGASSRVMTSISAYSFSYRS